MKTHTHTNHMQIQTVGLCLLTIHAGKSKTSANIKVHHFSLSSKTIPHTWQPLDDILINELCSQTPLGELTPLFIPTTYTTALLELATGLALYLSSICTCQVFINQQFSKVQFSSCTLNVMFKNPKMQCHYKLSEVSINSYEENNN